MVKKKEITLSYSRIKTWKSNHYDHYCKYVRGLRPKGSQSALVRGSMVHACIEAYHNGKSWKKTWKKLSDEFYENHFKEEIESLGDIPQLAYVLLENYFYYYEDSDDELETLENELHFVLPLYEDHDIIINIEGYIDSLVKKPDGKVFIRDYKTFSRMPEYSNLQFNFQSSIYIWAAEKLGYKIEGMEWDIIKPKMPTKPTLNKNGTLSKKAIDTTPLVAEQTLLELGLDPDDYEDFLDGLSFDNYFRRFFIRKNKAMVNAVMEDVIDSAIQIGLYGETWKDMNLDAKYMSSYMDLWRTEVSGGDIKPIIKQKYETKEERDGKEGKNKKGKEGSSKRNRIKNKKLKRSK